MDLDKILKIIQRKVLKCTCPPVTVKEIEADYLNSPYFEDIYMYVGQNILPSHKAPIRRTEI